MKGSQTLIATIALVALTACVPPASARTWLIHEDGSGDAPTIQAAIDSSVTGDTLRVGPGTYAEDIDYLGKDLVLESISGPAATILVGSESLTFAAVRVTGGQTRSSVLRGFTISKWNSAGIGIYESAPTILNNIVEGNSEGGIGCWGSTASPPIATFRPLIKDNIVRDNSGSSAISATGPQAPEIVNNLILGNEYGGIYLSTTAPGASVTGNMIMGNRHNFGAGIRAEWKGDVGASDYTIAWNLFIGNQLTYSVDNDPRMGGGGIYLRGTGAWVHHNTFVDNGKVGAQDSGVIMLSGEIGVLLSQNIVAFNPWTTGIVCKNSSDVQMRNNLVWENQPADLGIECEQFWADSGNLVANPEFCDLESGDYSLAQNSPAITHEAGPLGAIPIPGCGPVAVRPSTWGKIKSMYGP